MKNRKLGLESPLDGESGVSASTLDSLALKFNWTKTSVKQRTSETPPPQQKRPCFGLTKSNDPRIATYFLRPAEESAGARSEHVIAAEVFKTEFKKLSTQQKKEVRTIQKHEHRWRLDYSGEGTVFATDCLRNVSATRVGPDGRLLPCERCLDVLADAKFKSIISKPAPANYNYRFVNERFRKDGWAGIVARVRGLQEIVDDPDTSRSWPVKFAIGVLEGKYTDNEVFVGIVQAMVMRKDREERGVGLQNFKYAPAYDIFSGAMRIESPRTYELLASHIAAPTERTLRQKESGRPKVPLLICRETFILAADRIRILCYDGPVALSCDDTKLFATLRLFWDARLKKYFLVGAVGGPHEVADPEQVQAVMEDLKLVKATKVRLWVLQVPLPKVTPIILAAMPIDAMDAEQLRVPLKKIIDGLHEQCIHVASYSCDGTEVERKLQSSMTSNAPGRLSYTINHPRPGGQNLDITIPTYDDQPIVMTQDAKHALKTFRNNLFSGARLLTLGNFAATYSQVHDIALKDGSPLYHRDVEKVDRQDDNAASRLFSASTLEFTVSQYQDYVGLIIYLFVFGELVDAYQNRVIPHLERIKMVLRARYFLDTWISFLNSAQYTRTQHLLSREALDIASYLINALISLVFVHRDHYAGKYPLLPWLHSTEACEHVFGEARRIIKDFTMLDFYYMMPKLMIKLRETALRARTYDPKARASGYSHTYLDIHGIEMGILGVFPSDMDIEKAALEAVEEADSLVLLLGINPAQARAASAGTRITQLPGISAWYGPPDTDAEDRDYSSEDNTSEEGDSDSEGSVGEAQEIQDILTSEERDQWASNTGYSRSHSLDEKLLALSCAAFSVAADETTRMNAMPDPDDQFMKALAADESREIQRALDAMPATDLPDEASKPLGLGPLTSDMLDFSLLIQMRRDHETHQAKRGIRTAANYSAALQAAPDEKTLRRRIADKFHELRRSQQAQAAGTGADRASRWLTEPKAHGEGPAAFTAGPLPTGNAANAAAAATATARKALAKRKKLFASNQLPFLDDLVSARISQLRPLRLNDHVIVYLEKFGLMVAKVIAIYSKTGGKNGKHAAVVDVPNIAAISYIAVEAYSYIAARQFATIPHFMASWQVKRFALIPSYSALCALSNPPSIITPTGRSIEISPSDAGVFKQLQTFESKLPKLAKDFRKRDKSDGKEIEEEIEDDV
ncbi:hypothetical protein FA95DRAFT_1684813 [Auriscalpium vulgare]|uniref:Uncharacterized protein n=1 Tax=Auriscalpium vulgare TaxID=40419 RepID=A0ACB8R1X0_9AGAM|nr:hypothetical protein FA95DRAFT_1684813 [Auriscalpium vulgare]